MEGMVVMDYAQRFPEGLKEMATWLAEGKLQSREDIVEGLETFPETLLKLFSGEVGVEGLRSAAGAKRRIAPCAIRPAPRLEERVH